MLEDSLMSFLLYHFLQRMRMGHKVSRIKAGSRETLPVRPKKSVSNVAPKISASVKLDGWSNQTLVQVRRDLHH